ncbi:MAG: 2-oxoglutarate dehydrogenase complex dihydrolipoyllysine-residue succinyltransferase [Gammaproteobacteria bacterium]|nr:2-oxoglutarate dehydrogenase complex dihydrolipoyllysine-residue succinyltransferase [Gammaproteobacteria bacterium]
MKTEVKVPGFPESITDGTVVAWHKKPGEAVKRDEKLVDIETDKVMFEVPAPEDGTLGEILQPEGATVVAGQVLASIDAATGKPASAAVARGNGEDKTVPAQKIVMPAARRLLDEHGLSPDAVQASGKGGRILKEDVLRVLEQKPAVPVLRAVEMPARPEPAAAPAAPVTGDIEQRPERRVPMTRLRARIAERLVEAQHTAAILSTFNEVNMQPVMALRQRYRERFEKEHEVKLGFMSFFIKAVVEGLKKFPVINASVEDKDVIYHGYYDIGVAVSSPRGLVVPIIRDADRIGMAEIERRIAAYADKAKAGTLALEEISGGTFTITNGGVFGSLLSTPIINPPQSAILGMHKIQERPVVEEGAIVARPMMYVALSYDHRLIDGRDAVQFLVTVKEALEDPARMLLEV